MFQSKSRYNDKTWVGKAASGEYVALNSSGQPRDMYQPEVMGDQNYVTDVGCWDTLLNPLTDDDKEFLETAYVGQIEHCSECYDATFDVDEHETNPEYQFTVDGLVCHECFDAYASEHIEDYIDKPKQCIPLTSAESLADKGKLVFVERFIGGMVDGRGGYFGGERCNEGHPVEILKDLKAKFPNKRYVFSHDESGQFQTYFSVWQVATLGKRFKKSKR